LLGKADRQDEPGARRPADMNQGSGFGSDGRESLYPAILTAEFSIVAFSWKKRVFQRMK
jgi:hypothetical protein